MTRNGKAGRIAWLIVFTAAIGLAAGGVFAQEEEAEGAEEGPPLPLHTIEGVGGIVLTPMALLVNPGPPGTVVGKPAVSLQFATIGDKDFEVVALTWTFWRRLELGYAFNRLGLDDFEDDLQKVVAGADIGTSDVHLHHFNARLSLIEEGQWERSWLPAVTAGVHYKHNEDINEIDRRLGGALDGLGMKDNEGVDFTLTATKAVPVMGKPVLFSAGARASKGAQLGLLGFTDDYHVTFEGSALVLMTDRFAVGAEYRQKPDQLGRIPGVIGGEDDWWDVHAAYIVNDHMNVSATVGNAGTVLNHSDETLLGLVLKYEF